MLEQKWQGSFEEIIFAVQVVRAKTYTNVSKGFLPGSVSFEESAFCGNSKWLLLNNIFLVIMDIVQT